MNTSDVVLVHGCTHAEHDDNFRQVVERVKANSSSSTVEECVFSKIKISVVGDVRSPEEISAEPKVLEAIRKMNTPEIAEEMRSLLASDDPKLCAHLRNFVETIEGQVSLLACKRTGTIT